MPEILFAKGIASKLEQIIDEARSVIIMISPYVQFDNRIEEKLKFADERGVSIVLLHKPRELKEDALKFFNELKNGKSVPIRNLHTKCYLNDLDSVLLGSMNLYSYSEKNNWEMGVYFNFRNEDEVSNYQRIFSEIGAMLNSNLNEKDSDNIMNALGRLSPIQFKNGYVYIDGKRYSKEEYKSIHESFNVKTGYCIMCGKEIDYFPLHPYCIKCYKKWARENNPEQIENHCHRCGRNEDATINQPHCEICNEYYSYELGLHFSEDKYTS